MVDMVYFLICLFGLCALCFYAGIEFTAWIYHKEKRGVKNENRRKNI